MAEAKKLSHLEHRDSLPEDLKGVFDALVTDYKFLSTKHHGKAFVSYAILADLVRSGWRLAAPALNPGSSKGRTDKGRK